ncbi:MAG: hypothetical protein NZT92_20820 [Abditibacteriales bacterium]|nr:hypothetical protein [Abditibacteriales bacterium]MDW8368119.1 hypothetical protein [Abditibacteriales bacterium]
MNSPLHPSPATSHPLPLSARVRRLVVCWRQPLVATAWAVTLFFVMVVVKRWLPLGVPGEGQWVWAYRQPNHPVAPWFTLALPLLAFVVIVTIWAYLWEQSERGRLRGMGRWAALLFFVGGAMALRLTVQSVNPPQTQGASYIAWTIVSRVSTTYFADALSIRSVPEFLRTFPERQRQSDWHGQTHPPGTVLFFYLVNRAVHESPGLAKVLTRLMGWGSGEALSELRENVQNHTGVRLNDDTDLVGAAAVGYLLPLVGSVGILPLFLLTRRLFDERTAWAAVLLGLVVPSFNLFFPVVDQVYLVLAIAVVWLLADGLGRQGGDTRRLGNWEIAAAGAVLASGLFMTFAFLALLFLCVLWIGIASYRQRDVGLKWLVLFVVGLLLPLIMLYVLFGLNLLTVLNIALTAHGGVTERRWRGVWLVGNLIDFFVFIGLPIALLFMVSCWQHFRWQGGGLRRANMNANALLLSYLVTLLLLNVSGVVRGEVARIWMFLMPVPLVWAARAAVADESRGGLQAGILCSAVWLQTFVLQREVWFVRPW